MSSTPTPSPAERSPRTANDRASQASPAPQAPATSPKVADPANRRGTSEPERAGQSTTAQSNMTGWLSVVVAVALLALQIFYAVNAASIERGALEGYRSVITFGSLVLGLAGTVLALVGLAQRRRPRWPSLVGLSIGAYAFLIAVASWIGGLMNPGV